MHGLRLFAPLIASVAARTFGNATELGGCLLLVQENCMKFIELGTASTATKNQVQAPQPLDGLVIGSQKYRNFNQ